MSLRNAQPGPEPKNTSILQTLTRFGTVGVLIAVLYVGWVFYSRHASDERAAAELAAKQQAKQQEDANLIFGNGEVKINSYSVSRPLVSRGESAELCYGVVNATKVVIDPHVEDSKPSSYHCLSVAPKETTTYVITASNDKGQSKSLAITLRVR